MHNFKDFLKKSYHFIFHDDSALSWIVNIILAFLLVKFIIYPGLALILGSSLPLVAVISGSMEHEGLAFDQWWEANGAWYEEQGISKEMFQEYRFMNGFDKGDVIVLVGAEEVVQGTSFPRFGDHSSERGHTIICLQLRVCSNRLEYKHYSRVAVFRRCYRGVGECYEDYFLH